MYNNLKWHGKPPKWSVTGDRLTIVTGDRTDVWNQTFYGFTRSNAHLFYHELEGDFSAEITLHAAFETLYDQLGLMVRADDQTWLKTGLEFSDDRAQLSTVLTRDNWSDWSTATASDADVKAGIRIRLTRHGNVMRIQKQDQSGTWHLTRLGYIDLPPKTQVGPMCCSPERAGFRAEFSNFQIGPAIPRDLHD